MDALRRNRTPLVSDAVDPVAAAVFQRFSPQWELVRLLKASEPP